MGDIWYLLHFVHFSSEEGKLWRFKAIKAQLWNKFMSLYPVVSNQLCWPWSLLDMQASLDDIVYIGVLEKKIFTPDLGTLAILIFYKA